MAFALLYLGVILAWLKVLLGIPLAPSLQVNLMTRPLLYGEQVTGVLLTEQMATGQNQYVLAIIFLCCKIQLLIV